MEDTDILKIELEKLEVSLKNEISNVKSKYSNLKKELREKYPKKKKEKKKTIPKTLKNDVWDKYIGKTKGVGPCTCCSKEIEQRSFHCGHVKSEYNGGNTNIENLRPLCSICNTSMSTQNLFEFKNEYYPQKVSIPLISLEYEIDNFLGIKMNLL